MSNPAFGIYRSLHYMPVQNGVDSAPSHCGVVYLETQFVLTLVLRRLWEKVFFGQTLSVVRATALATVSSPEQFVTACDL